MENSAVALAESANLSEQVTIACANCHEPYRDFDDQSQRCTPVDGKQAE